jgi:spore germination cell wall hydrolase CwlJ-like protein
VRARRTALWAATAYLAVGWFATNPPTADGRPPRLRDPRPQAPAIALPSALNAQREADAGLLAELAVGEDPSAALAVVWVAINRAGRGPVLAAVAAPRQFHGWRARTRAWRRAHGRGLAQAAVWARAALDGRAPDPTGGATHFHRAGTWVPPWAPAPRTWRRIGKHWFYRIGG